MADVREFSGRKRPPVHASEDVSQIIDILSNPKFDGREIAISLAKHDPRLFLELYAKSKSKVSNV